MTLEEQLRQNARHEAAHATVGFETGLSFATTAIWVGANPLTEGPAGAVTFYQQGHRPGEWVGALLAGPMYERLARLDLFGGENIATEIPRCLDDSRNTAYALSLLLETRKLIPDLPLDDMTYDSANRRFKDWNEMRNHLDSPKWKLCLDFHKEFFHSLVCLSAGIPPVVGNERKINAVALLRWFAVQTRQLLDKHTTTVEALATELLTEKRLKGGRYIMSESELVSFLTAHQTTEQQ